MKWLSVGLIATLLASTGLPVAVLTSSRVMAAPDTWTQTTVAEFESGTLEHVEAVIWDPGDPADDGDVILESQTADQENWGPSQAPATPKIYGPHYHAQTFQTSKGGPGFIYFKATVYVSKYGSPMQSDDTTPADLVVELWDCASTNPDTATPQILLNSDTISSSQIVGAGGYDVDFVLSSPMIIGYMYAIVVHAEDNGGDSNNYYKWYYDGDYLSGKGWKQPPSAWGGGGFGGHDGTFKIYISDEEDGKGYYSSGTITSPTHDAGTSGSANWGIISWDETPNGQTIIMKVRTSSDGTTWSTDWGDCPAVTNGQDISGL